MSRLGYVGRLVRELFAFAMAYKAWWMVPLVLVLLVLGFLVATSQTLAPFVYTLF